MAKAGSQHFRESVSLLWECTGRQRLLAKSFEGPSPVMLHSRSAAVQYQSTGHWLTQEDQESSQHPITVTLNFSDRCQVPTEDCPCPKSSSAVFLLFDP